MRPVLLLLSIAEVWAVLRAPPLAPPPHLQRYAERGSRSSRALPLTTRSKKTTYPLDAAIQTVINVFKPKDVKAAPISTRSVRPHRLPQRQGSRARPQAHKFVRPPPPPHGGKPRPQLRQRPIPNQQQRQQFHPRPPPHVRRPPIKPQIVAQANVRPRTRPARSKLKGSPHRAPPLHHKHQKSQQQRPQHSQPPKQFAKKIIPETEHNKSRPHLSKPHRSQASPTISEKPNPLGVNTRPQ